MAENVLLIDQGNTRLKWVRARGGELLEDTAGRGDFEAFTRACEEQEAPDSIRLSSVAGEDAVSGLVEFCRACWGVEPAVMRSAANHSGVSNGYESPEKLGVDRWLAIVGAVSRHGKPVVVWDLGTATTIDAVDEYGNHIGGMIYPGPATMLRSLGRDTKLKVPDDLSGAGIAAGRSTAACISNGVLAAQLGALNQFMRACPESMGQDPKLVITGGAAGELIPALDFPFVHDPWLVFRGMLAAGVR